MDGCGHIFLRSELLPMAGMSEVYICVFLELWPLDPFPTLLVAVTLWVSLARNPYWPVDTPFPGSQALSQFKLSLEKLSPSFWRLRDERNSPRFLSVNPAPLSSSLRLPGTCGWRSSHCLHPQGFHRSVCWPKIDHSVNGKQWGTEAYVSQGWDWGGLGRGGGGECSGQLSGPGGCGSASRSQGGHQEGKESLNY